MRLAAGCRGGCLCGLVDRCRGVDEAGVPCRVAGEEDASDESEGRLKPNCDGGGTVTVGGVKDGCATPW